jgi:purine-binding chemotaxis protein CheW
MINKKKKNTFLSFRIGKETFAVSVQKALEVLEKQYITVVPNVPDYVEGVINFRGKIIPVIDGRLKFNLPKRQEGEKYVVIVFDLLVNDKKMVIGAMADSVHDVIAFDEDNILEVPELGFNYNAEFILGMLKKENSFTMILDIDKVFSAEDVNLITKVSEENPEIMAEESIEISDKKAIYSGKKKGKK